MKKAVLMIFAACVCMLTVILCVVITGYGYGSEATFYSHNGESVYFDGKGTCVNGDIECRYYIKNNQYYITSGKVTRKMTLVEEGVLVDFSQSGLTLDTKVRSGPFEAKFNVGSEKYIICGDGTFGYDCGKFALRLGEYFYNDGVLAFRYDNKSQFNSETREFYIYVDDLGDVYGALLANPECFFRR